MPGYKILHNEQVRIESKAIWTIDEYRINNIKDFKKINKKNFFWKTKLLNLSLINNIFKYRVVNMVKPKDHIIKFTLEIGLMDCSNDVVWTKPFYVSYDKDRVKKEANRIRDIVELQWKQLPSNIEEYRSINNETISKYISIVGFDFHFSFDYFVKPINVADKCITASIYVQARGNPDELVSVKYCQLQYLGSLEAEVQKINAATIEIPTHLSIEKIRDKLPLKIFEFFKDYTPDTDNFYYETKLCSINYSPAYIHHFVTTCCFKIIVFHKDKETGDIKKAKKANLKFFEIKNGLVRDKDHLLIATLSNCIKLIEKEDQTLDEGHICISDVICEYMPNNYTSLKITDVSVIDDRKVDDFFIGTLVKIGVQLTDKTSKIKDLTVYKYYTKSKDRKNFNHSSELYAENIWFDISGITSWADIGRLSSSEIRNRLIGFKYIDDSKYEYLFDTKVNSGEVILTITYQDKSTKNIDTVDLILFEWFLINSTFQDCFDTLTDLEKTLCNLHTIDILGIPLFHPKEDFTYYSAKSIGVNEVINALQPYIIGSVTIKENEWKVTRIGFESAGDIYYRDILCNLIIGDSNDSRRMSFRTKIPFKPGPYKEIIDVASQLKICQWNKVTFKMLQKKHIPCDFFSGFDKHKYQFKMKGIKVHPYCNDLLIYFRVFTRTRPILAVDLQILMSEIFEKIDWLWFVYGFPHIGFLGNTDFFLSDIWNNIYATQNEYENINNRILSNIINRNNKFSKALFRIINIVKKIDISNTNKIVYANLCYEFKDSNESSSFVDVPIHLTISTTTYEFIKDKIQILYNPSDMLKEIITLEDIKSIMVGVLFLTTGEPVFVASDTVIEEDFVINVNGNEITASGLLNYKYGGMIKQLGGNFNLLFNNDGKIIDVKYQWKSILTDDIKLNLTSCKKKVIEKIESFFIIGKFIEPKLRYTPNSRIASIFSQEQLGLLELKLQNITNSLKPENLNEWIIMPFVDRESLYIVERKVPCLASTAGCAIQFYSYKISLMQNDNGTFNVEQTQLFDEAVHDKIYKQLSNEEISYEILHSCGMDLNKIREFNN